MLPYLKQADEAEPSPYSMATSKYPGKVKGPCNVLPTKHSYGSGQTAYSH